MARIRRHISYSDTRAELAEVKDLRRGAFEDEFWDEDELVDHHRVSKKKKSKKKRGCPENDYKAHVYVWETRYRSFWSDKIYKVDEKICCGCGKIDTRKYHW